MAAQLPERSFRGLTTRRPAVSTPGASVAPVATAESADTRHNWLLYLFLFLLPLQNLQTGHMPNLGGGLNFMNVGFALALMGAWRVRGHLTCRSGINIWVWLYLGYGLLSVLYGYSTVPAGDDPNRLNVFKDSALGVLLIFVVQMSVTDWAALRRVVLVTILPLAYILRVTWSEHQSVSSWHYNDDLRIQGTLSLLGANEFAAFCVTVALVLFAVLLATRLSKAWRALLLFGIGSMVACILWSYSRTAYIAVLVGAVCILLLWRGRWKMALPLALAFVILPPLLPQSVVDRFDTTHVEGAGVDESTELRYTYWGVAWDAFLKHPLVGSGNETFTDINPYSKDTHNLYLRELAEKGAIGFLITLGLFLAMGRACWRTFRDSPQGSFGYALALGMCGAWVALVIGNVWGDRFTYAQMIGYFWVFLALTLKAREFAMAERAAAATRIAIVPDAEAGPDPEPAKPRFAQPRRRARRGFAQPGVAGHD